MRETFIEIAITGLVMSIIVACAMAGIAIWLEQEWENMLLFGTSVVSCSVAFVSLSFPCNNVLGWTLGTISCMFFSSLTYVLYVLVMLHFGYLHSDGILFHTNDMITILESTALGGLVFLFS